MENSVNGTAAKVVGVSIKQDSHMQDDSVMPASANSECATVQGLKTNSYYKRCSLCGAFWGGVCGGVCGAVCGAWCCIYVVLCLRTIFVFNPGAAPPRESSCSDIYFGISKVDAHVHTYA